MDSASIAAQLADYDKNAVTSTSAMNEALSKYGIPEIRNTVSGLRTTVANTTNALKQVDPSVTGRTSGSLVTEAQRQKQVANERAPIAEQLGEQTSAMSDQERALNEALGLATGEANNKVSDYQAGRSALQSRYDMTYKREADQKEEQRQQAALQESIRQFNESNKTTRAGQASKASSSAAATPGSAQRKDGGFNFTDASGNAISARLYAQLTGTSFNTLLKKMAASGDKGAAEVLKSGGKAASYKALTWD